MDEPTLIERLARYLATMEPSDGATPHWPGHIERAATIIALLKEPDPAMVQAGEGEIWRAMVDAALRGRWTLEAALQGHAEAVSEGSDEEGEIHLSPSDVSEEGRASWVAIGPKHG